MRKAVLIGTLIALVCGAQAVLAAPAARCPPAQGVALQALGTGGPIADDARASTGYLVWVDGASRVLIDAGGGTFLRFAEAGADFSALEFIGLSHFHTDHSADFPALLKSHSFSKSDRPLPVAGPGPGGPFPGLGGFLAAMLGEDGGAYAYLSGYLDGSRGYPKILTTEVAGDQRAAVTVIDGAGIGVDALHVPHGPVPALAFRVRAGDALITFSSDQNGSDPAFVDFARGSTALVMHMPIPEGAEGVARSLHAPPSVIGNIAREAGVGRLVLSHFMARSLRDMERGLEVIRARYDGPVLPANDLECIVLSGRTVVRGVERPQ